MKKIYLIALGLCLVFLGFGQFKTPTIDGTIATNEYGTHINGVNQQANGAPTTFITWDATNLYIGVTSANITESFIMYLDKDALVPINSGTNANGTNVGFNYDGTNFGELPYRADLVLYVKNNYREYKTANGSNGWNSSTSGFGSYAENGGTNTREFSIPWSVIGGIPSSFNFFNYVTSGGGFVYAQTPTENAGGNIGTSARYTRYYTVTNTANGAATVPFSRNCYVFNSTADLTNFGIISVYDFTMNTAGRFISRSGSVGGDWNIGGGLIMGAGSIYLGSGGSGYGNTNIFGNMNLLGGTFDMDATTGTVNLAGANSSLNIASGATLKLSSGFGGDFNLKGDFTNAGTFTPNNRQVAFNGTAAQSITGATTFDYLALNNNTGLILNAPVTVDNTLTLTNGSITLGSNNLTVNNSLIGIFNSANHIITNGTGGLTLPVTTTVKTYDFPVGPTTNYKPAKIAFTVAPTAAGTLTARWIEGVGGSAAIGTAGLPLTESSIPGGSANISIVNFNGIWDVSAGSGLIGGTYTASFIGNNTTGIINELHTNLIKRDNSSANWTNPGTHVTTTGSITNPILSRSGLTGFSQFGIGGTLTSLPLAVNSFTASKQNNNTNTINWKATCTGASVTFELQRSNNGVTFLPINSLTATQARCAATFNFVDNYNATSPITYYKLKVISNTGEIKYSQIIAINNKNTVSNTLAIYPNVVKDKAVLVIESKTSTNANFVITDAKGAIIKKFNENLSEGANAYPLSLGGLPSGSYQISGIVDGALKTIRFIKSL